MERKIKLSASTVISTVDNITLVTLVGFPAQVDSISKIFQSIAQYNINIDMISMAPTHGAFTGLSFTISDNDLVDVLAFTTQLKKETDVNVIVSSVTPGIAAKVFGAIANTKADLRLITTSEVEISLLVTEADFDTVLSAIEKTMA